MNKALSPIRDFPSLLAFYDALRDGSAFEGATPTNWLEVSTCIDPVQLDGEAPIAKVNGADSPEGHASGWRHVLTPAQIDQLNAANDGSQGAGLVVIHDYGAEIHLANWPS